MDAAVTDGVTEDDCDPDADADGEDVRDNAAVPDDVCVIDLVMVAVWLMLRVLDGVNVDVIDGVGA